MIAASVTAAVTLGAPAAYAETPATTPRAAQSCALVTPLHRTICVSAAEDLEAAVTRQTGLHLVTKTTVATNARAASAGTASVYLQATLYDDKGYGGGQFEIFGSGPCVAGGATWTMPDIGSAWYGRVSAVKGDANCRVKIFAQTDFGGASFGYVDHASYVGDAMNDKTKSVRLHH